MCDCKKAKITRDVINRMTCVTCDSLYIGITQSHMGVFSHE
jgi:hypothetical protein